MKTCYVCGNPIQSKEYTVVPEGEGVLYRHRTKCYPNSVRWNKNKKLKKSYAKQFKKEKE